HRSSPRNLLCCLISVRHWRVDFRNSVVAIERPCIRQLSLGYGVDPLQFHGGPGDRERDRRIIENSAMATAVFVRCAGGARRIVWVHGCVWPSSAWRVDAPRVANTLELSAD